MKLIIAIVQDDFATKVIKNLMAKKYRTTKLSSTGGFLKAGNTTLLIGIENERVDEVINIIEKECKSEKVAKGKGEITVDGAHIFILDMYDSKKI